VLRCRRPSLRKLTGDTRVKRQPKRELGISQVQAWTGPSRVKQRATQHVGYYSRTMRLIRNAAKGWFPSFLGLLAKKLPSRAAETRIAPPLLMADDEQDPGQSRRDGAWAERSVDSADGVPDFWYLGHGEHQAAPGGRSTTG